MNRTLPIVNLLGVAALAVLCVVQWQRDRNLNLALRDAEKARQVQVQKLAEQEKNLKGLTEDATQFKEQITRLTTENRDAQKKLHDLERDNVQLSGERDQLRESVTNWANAVGERDSRIKEANTRITQLANQLNENIQKYNQLATNHNDLVSRYNELAQKIPRQGNKGAETGQKGKVDANTQ